MTIQTYLFFEGTCEAALDFYKHAVGAEVQMLMRYRDAPDPGTRSMVPPGNDDKIMHASFRIGDSIVMGSDGRASGRANFQGFSLSLTVKAPAEAERAFTALADGGQVDLPLAKTFWAPLFGMLTDRFGVRWMVQIAP
jgi:PhnB protein